MISTLDKVLKATLTKSVVIFTNHHKTKPFWTTRRLVGNLNLNGKSKWANIYLFQRFHIQNNGIILFLNINIVYLDNFYVDHCKGMIDQSFY